MVDEPFYMKREREAGERLAALLALPMPTHKFDIGSEGFFDPWEMFPLYGSYSSDFDECAIQVLDELQTGDKTRHDLGSEMFREMLCNLDLCEYGTSPRVCFPTGRFKELVPALIERWKAFSALQWASEE